MPDYNCVSCLQKEERGIKRDCAVLRCRMGREIAESEEINFIIDSYLSTKWTPIIKETPTLVERILDEAGLLDHLVLLKLLEIEFHEHKNKKTKTDQIKRRHKSLLNG